MKTFKKILKKSWIWILSVLFAFFVLWFLFWPLNSLIESPGEAVSLQPMVKIAHTKPDKNNDFMITAVSMQQARPVTYLIAKFNPTQSIQSQKAVMGSSNSQEYTNLQNIYMKTAINSASYVAYSHAHKKVKPKFHGVYILNVFPRSDFAHKLKPGDLVESVNGKKLTEGLQYIAYIQHLPKKSMLKIKYKRNGKEHVATGHKNKIVKGFYGIGIGMTDDMSLTTDPKIHVNPGQIGGPSGGLMFALQIYSELTGEKFKPKKIAGTGTIAPNGAVGEIGGIDKKIVAANASGAKLFFAPYVKPTKAQLKMETGHKTNYQVAKEAQKKYAPKMKVVPVTSFDEALKYLKKHS